MMTKEVLKRGCTGQPVDHAQLILNSNLPRLIDRLWRLNWNWTVSHIGWCVLSGGRGVVFSNEQPSTE